jgi:magnesium chelatase family protein
MDDAGRLGVEGEEEACRLLRRMGYRIVQRNWRTKWGEIDIVARDGDVMDAAGPKRRSARSSSDGSSRPRGASSRRRSAGCPRASTSSPGKGEARASIETRSASTMFGRLTSGALHGIEARLIEVQCDVAGGLPSFQIVGLPDKEVSESRERIRSAIRNAGLSFPPGRITANLAPADLRKQGVAFDLPIALAILVASGQAPPPTSPLLIVGELALDGEVRAVPGVLPIAMEAKASGMSGMIVPSANAAEAALVEGLATYPVGSLADATRFLKGELAVEPIAAAMGTAEYAAMPDLAEVRGQFHAKRALEVAAAGGHNLLMVGPPGAGKSLLASCLPGLLPPLSPAEALDVTRIYSVTGLLEPGESLVTRRPFRAPHHTISYAGMVGGGQGIPGPGEITLAHCGVLFLDEIPEFDRRVLETLRQPIEDGSILLARSGVSIRYPAAFTLVAAMNPCPCGHLGDDVRACTCSPREIQRYRRRLSGPFLDRIDLFVDVPRLASDELLELRAAEPTREVRARVLKAREAQWARFKKTSTLSCNARLQGAELRKHGRLDAEGTRLLRRAISRFGLSGRGHARVLRVARTLADLDGQAGIRAAHLAEALQYRDSRGIRDL